MEWAEREDEKEWMIGSIDSLYKQKVDKQKKSLQQVSIFISEHSKKESRKSVFGQA